MTTNDYGTFDEYGLTRYERREIRKSALRSAAIALQQSNGRPSMNAVPNTIYAAESFEKFILGKILKEQND